MENQHLQAMEVQARRGLLDAASEKDYYRYKQGFVGELDFLALLEEFQLSHYQRIHDLALDYQGKCQIDLLLIYESVIYLLEIKNYFGRFDYSAKGQCLLGGQALGEDIVRGVRRRALKLGHLLDQGGLGHFQIQPVLAFVNPFCQVGSLELVPSDLVVVSRCEVPAWIQSIQRARHRRVPLKDYQDLVALFERYRDPTSYLPPPIEDLSLGQMKRGLFCPHCRRGLERVGKIYSQCQTCGQRLHKADLLYLACSDLALLAHPNPRILTRPNLKALVGSAVGETYIHRHLKEHYQAHGQTRQRYYTFLPERSPIRTFTTADLEALRKYW
ncbi:nuclease-related domain-containing protein [Hutsoniella sourekii]